MNFSKRCLAVALFCSGASSPIVQAVDATTESERRYLIQLIAELDRASEMAGKAAAEADGNARFLLDYETLHSDIQEIRRAIEAHANAPARSPRTIDPLPQVKAKPRS